MKKLVSVLLSVMMIVSILSSNAVTAAAAAESSTDNGGIMPMYAAGYMWTSTLYFTGKTANCSSTMVVFPGEKWISVTQSLEREMPGGNWQTEAIWTTYSTDNVLSCLFTNTKTVSFNGNYRVKSVYIVESVSGKRETITAYSQIVSI